MAKYRFRVNHNNIEEAFARMKNFFTENPHFKYLKVKGGDDTITGGEVSLIHPEIELLDDNHIIMGDLLLGNERLTVPADDSVIIEIDTRRKINVYSISDHMVGYKTKIIDEHECVMTHTIRVVSKMSDEETSSALISLMTRDLYKIYSETPKDSLYEHEIFECEASYLFAHAIQNAFWSFRPDMNRIIHISAHGSMLIQVVSKLPGDITFEFDSKAYSDLWGSREFIKGYDIHKAITYHYVDNVNDIKSHEPMEFFEKIESAFGFKHD